MALRPSSAANQTAALGLRLGLLSCPDASNCHRWRRRP